MLRYILILIVLIGCQKKAVPTELFNIQRVELTCEKNPLLCEDFEDDDLPEPGEETDTGE